MPGSRSQTPASASSGPSTEHTSMTSTDPANTSTSPRISGEIETSPSQHATSRRSHRQGGTGGGFLLGSLTATSRTSPESRRYGSLKGKHRLVQEKVATPHRYSAYEQWQTSAQSSTLSNGDSSTNGDTPGSRGTPEPRPRPISHSPYLTESRRHDPAQLVNIALQLNQSRQRQASARFQPGISSRVVSGASAVPVGQSSARDPASYPQPGKVLTIGAVIANGLDTQRQDSVGAEGYTDSEGPAALEFYPSPQTLIRAERARIALELKYHHRRILQHLPQLPLPSQLRPRTPSTTHSDGSGPQVIFGRTYNPLQYARNRRIRMQKRSPLHPERDGWNDVDRVIAWVQEVAAQRHVQITSPYDNYPLPDFGLYGSQFLGNESTSIESPERPNAGTRVPLPPNDWAVAGAELFADIYWLQEDGNRYLIEDPNGDKLYPTTKRMQVESDGRRRSLFDASKRLSSLPRRSADSGRGSANERAAATVSEIEHSSRKKAPKVLSNSPLFKDLKGKKSTSSPARQARAASVSSSDDDRTDRRRLPRPWSKNFGKQWEGTQMPARQSLELLRHNKEMAGPGRISLEVASRPSTEIRRPFSIELQRPDEEQVTQLMRSDTVSDLDSTAPDSPLHVATVPSMALDFDSEKIFGSPPPKRTKEIADRHHEVELRDFAEDPFQATQSGMNATRKLGKSHTSALSSPSETSFSADSDNRSRPQMRRHQTDRLPMRSPEETVFKVPKPWRAGKYVAGRVGDLLRRKDYASDTSETDEDTRRNNLKLQLSRATTGSPNRRGTLSRTSTLSGVGESPGYKPPELPSFSPLRREGTTGSPSRIKASETISQRLNTEGLGENLLSPASAGLKSPSRSLTPQLSRMASTEGKEGSNSSQRTSIQANGNGRRGATVTDTSGQQWPLSSRSNVPAWPGEEDLHRPDNATWIGPELRPAKSDVVAESDILRTETLFRSLCFKAANAAHALRCVPSEPGSLLVEVREQHEKGHPAVAKLEEPVVLSTFLCKSIDANTDGLNTATERFLNGSIRRLERQMDDVKVIVHEKLTGLVMQASDDADGLGHQLAAGLTREVRDLNDRIDHILRARRRRSRLLRRILFGTLEWIITATMWAAWLLVVVFKMVRGVFRVVAAVFRWLFLL